MNKKTINYSLIIPNRNITNLLQRCVNSVPYRDDLQIIIVDDNSDPNVVDFNHYPGSNRDDVEIVFTKEGKGAGYARNVGLDKAKGRWLLFSDSDDTFETENLNFVLEKYANSDVDIIFLNAKKVNATTGEELISGNPIREQMDATKPVAQKMDWFRLRSNVPWGKLIKKELVDKHNIRFSEVIAANDLYFSVQSGYYASNVIIDNTIIYNWLFRDSGNVSHNFSKEAVWSRYTQTVKRNEFLREKGLDQWCGNVFRYMRRFKSVGFSRWYAFKLFCKDTPNKMIVPHFIEMIKLKKF